MTSHPREFWPFPTIVESCKEMKRRLAIDSSDSVVLLPAAIHLLTSTDVVRCFRELEGHSIKNDENLELCSKGVLSFLQVNFLDFKTPLQTPQMRYLCPVSLQRLILIWKGNKSYKKVCWSRLYFHSTQHIKEYQEKVYILVGWV